MAGSANGSISSGCGLHCTNSRFTPALSISMIDPASFSAVQREPHKAVRHWLAQLLERHMNDPVLTVPTRASSANVGIPVYETTEPETLGRPSLERWEGARYFRPGAVEWWAAAHTLGRLRNEVRRWQEVSVQKVAPPLHYVRSRGEALGGWIEQLVEPLVVAVLIARRPDVEVIPLERVLGAQVRDLQVDFAVDGGKWDLHLVRPIEVGECDRHLISTFDATRPKHLAGERRDDRHTGILVEPAVDGPRLRRRARHRFESSTAKQGAEQERGSFRRLRRAFRHGAGLLRKEVGA